MTVRLAVAFGSKDLSQTGWLGFLLCVANGFGLAPMRIKVTAVVKKLVIHELTVTAVVKKLVI